MKVMKSVCLDAQHEELLKRLAEEERRSESAVIRRAIRQYAEASE